MVAGLESAAGETVIYTDCFHIERGYEDICRDLAAGGCGYPMAETREAKEKRALS